MNVYIVTWMESVYEEPIAVYATLDAAKRYVMDQVSMNGGEWRKSLGGDSIHRWRLIHEHSGDSLYGIQEWVVQERSGE